MGRPGPLNPVARRYTTPENLARRGAQHVIPKRVILIKHLADCDKKVVKQNGGLKPGSGGIEIRPLPFRMHGGHKRTCFACLRNSHDSNRAAGVPGHERRKAPGITPARKRAADAFAHERAASTRFYGPSTGMLLHPPSPSRVLLIPNPFGAKISPWFTHNPECAWISHQRGDCERQKARRRVESVRGTPRACAPACRHDLRLAGAHEKSFENKG